MFKILGIVTSNYNTSAAVADNKKLVYDIRVSLNVKMGERGLRRYESLFRHIKCIGGSSI